MTLLQEIQDAATDSKVDISIVLRKAKILAARLRDPEFDGWVNRELNGYESGATLPPYRIVDAVEVRGNLTDGFRQFNNFSIMTSFLPPEWRAWGEGTHLSQPIATIASMAAQPMKDGTILQVPWPQELAVKYGAKGYNNRMQCLGAWQVVNPSSLVGVVDSVRNRLLDFALKIQAENPDAGEAQPNSEPVPAERVRTIVQNTFYGPVTGVVQNSQNFSQTANIGIPPQDLARLVKDLTEHIDELNLDARQRQRAEAQIATLKAELDGPPDPSIVAQAGRTLRSITEGAIGSLIANATQPAIWRGIQQALSSIAS